MGGSTFSRDEYVARETFRSTNKISAFDYDDKIKKGAVAARVHEKMNPLNVRRESRDSDKHPVSIPIMVIFDTTGSMQGVPVMLQKKLAELMGAFLDDKASGKKYLGEGYPAILMGAVDDFSEMGVEGALQVGQFESGIEIDDDLGRLWLTGRGGGTYEESYDLALYFAAMKTDHDHLDKRGKKGYLFLIGDEKPYPSCNKGEVKKVIGDTIQADIPIKDLIERAQEKYHVFFIIPKMTSHWGDPVLEKRWRALLPQQNVLLLENPDDICKLIAGAVAICEEHISYDEMEADMVTTSLSKALAPLSKNHDGGVSKYSSSNLPTIGGSSAGNDRL